MGQVTTASRQPTRQASRQPTRQLRHKGVRALGVGMALAAVATLAAACGSSGASGTTSTTAGAGAGGNSGSSTHAVLTAATVSKVGKVLVDSKGWTVYIFSKDKNGKPTCDTGACASIWPPVYVTGSPTAGTGVKASMLGTVKTASGKLQLTYDHWPLYTYTGDTAAGQANGEGISAFGGKWSAITTAGTAVASSSSSSSSSSSGGGW